MQQLFSAPIIAASDGLPFLNDVALDSVMQDNTDDKKCHQAHIPGHVMVNPADIAVRKQLLGTSTASISS